MKELNLKNSIRPEAFQTTISKIVRAKALNTLKNINGKILDVGCGNGIFLLESEVNFSERISIYGVDLDFTALKNAKVVFKDNDLEPKRLILGNGYQLPFANNSFNTVFCLNTLVNLAPLSIIEKLLTELYRVCRPGGLIIFDYRNGYNPILTCKYRINLVTRSLSTFAYKWKHFIPLVTKLNAKKVALYPLGKNNKFLAVGFLLVLEK
ncbi:MAG: class I SAM-dependent methyltransferase [Candidatus Marinimicrobia bacterium]|nr:class I SAM-dependent methyltransferase [Candidatus Neomarinimicrobiota bacterium]